MKATITPATANVWMPVLASRFRDLLTTDAKAAHQRSEALVASGASIVFEQESNRQARVYFEMRLEDALTTTAVDWSWIAGGKHHFLAQRLLAHAFGPAYTQADVLRVQAEVEKLDALVNEVPPTPAPASEKTPGKEKKARKKVAK